MAEVVDHGVDVPDRMYVASAGGRAVRVGALLVLVLAALTIFMSLAPAQRSAQDLSADLAAGRVGYVEYEPGARTVHWVVDQVLWRQAQLPAQLPAPLAAQPAGRPADGNPWGQDMTWLEQQISASGHTVRLDEVDEVNPHLWVFRIPSRPLGLAAGAVWVMALVHMLATGGHRVANRWAWFWMFTFGQLGVVLYLLCEPVPLSRSRLFVLGQRPIGGGMGLVYSVLLAFAFSVLSFAAALALRG